MRDSGSSLGPCHSVITVNNMAMLTKGSEPPLVQLPYEEGHPKNLWKECVKLQKRWNIESKSSPTMKRRMAKYRKSKIVNLVWVSNKLEGTLPEGATESETSIALTPHLAGFVTNAASDRRHTESLPVACSGNNDSMEYLTGKRQLLQHMQAYCRLETAIDDGEELSESLIMQTHGILMNGLENCGRPVSAGAYRQISVFADNHQFPDHHCVPTEMSSIVREYNSRLSDPSHDPYQLASWLLYEVISLHPFEDGNGRLCRLLWSYSLMRDGLPFPTALTSGHKKARKHCIDALVKSRRPGIQHHPYLTSLTVLSVHNAWDKFSWDNETH